MSPVSESVKPINVLYLYKLNEFLLVYFINICVRFIFRILRERETWDTSLVKWRVVARLDNTAEVFQFLTASVPPTPPKDYCVLR